LAIILYVLSRFVVYPLGISNCWPLYCMFFLDSWFTRWVSSTFGHCIVCSFSLCGLPVGYHQPLTIVLYVLSRFVVYPLGIINLWPLHCMFFLGLRFLFTNNTMVKGWWYPTGKPQSEKEHTIQWPKVDDTQRVNHKARKNIQYNGQRLMIPNG
jgi:hypothetical protein